MTFGNSRFFFIDGQMFHSVHVQFVLLSIFFYVTGKNVCIVVLFHVFVIDDSIVATVVMLFFFIITQSHVDI